jgi:hypothetical protein
MVLFLLWDYIDHFAPALGYSSDLFALVATLQDG